MKLFFVLIVLSFCEGNERKDYYKILQVDQQASLAQIKKAFRDLAKSYHPDKNSSPDAKQKFTDIQEAYDVLKSQKTREMYDRSRAEGFDFNPSRPQGGFHGFRPAFFRSKPFKFNFESLFEDIAGFDTVRPFRDFGFGGFGFEDLFKDFDNSRGNGKEGQGGKKKMSCKTVVKKMGGLTTTITQCN